MKKNNIILLPENVSNLIAAGEIIERPSSMLKELIENSIDANASEIRVYVDEAGIKSMVVEDDGVGILFDELAMAVTHHATSKIKTIDDLEKIYTLGFRGEALASIADVTQLTIESKNEDEDAGGVIRVYGGKIADYKPHPFSKGTRVTAKNLFYNIPARHKFLKHNSREFALIKEVFEAEALAHYNISMQLTNNDRLVLDYKKARHIKERVFDYLEVKSENNEFLEIKTDGEYFSVYGLISSASLTQSFRKNNFLFLNNRPVENKSISFAVRNAYSSVIAKDRYPYYFIYINVDSSKVDVNVHPTKKEVRLKNERDISGAVYNAVVKTLNSSRDFSSVNIGNDLGINNSYKSSSNYYYSNPSDNKNKEDDIYNNSFKIFNRENKTEHNLNNFEEENLIDKSVEQYLNNIAYRNDDNDNNYSSNEENEIESKNGSEKTNEENKCEVFGSYTKAIGQIFSSYIVAEKMNEMYIIDQHAAYERLNYERIYKALKNRKIEKERLLIPIEFVYRDYEIDILLNHKEALNTIGIDFEMNSKTSILIDFAPLYIPKNYNTESIIKDILDSFILDDKNTSLEKLVQHTCATIACKYSPKSNYRLTLNDMQTLIDLLEKENILKSCPHGRPFILRIEKSYLDRKFFRI